jgi:hypothetical protein
VLRQYLPQRIVSRLKVSRTLSIVDEWNMSFLFKLYLSQACGRNLVSRRSPSHFEHPDRHCEFQIMIFPRDRTKLRKTVIILNVE